MIYGLRNCIFSPGKFQVSDSMPLLILGAKLWNFIAAVAGMISDVVQFWNYVCDVIIRLIILLIC